MRAYLIGSGIASLAAAAYLIRDGGLLPANVTIFEADDRLGGAMGMFGDSEEGYVLPTGRIFEAEFRCAREFFSLVPSATNPHRSIWDEIVEFNKRYGYYTKVRLLDRNGVVTLQPHLGLTPQDRLDLVKLALTPEPALDGKAINDFFAPEFFGSDFWLLWTSMMNSLPQHSAAEFRRFINRFLHLFPDLPTMTKVWRTPFDQSEAIVEPVVDWLRRQGVIFITNALVTDVEFEPSLGKITANSLEVFERGKSSTIEVEPDDIVLVTTGSQTADLSIGSMTEPPRPRRDGRSWALWRRLAQGRPGFGRPEVFFGEDKTSATTWMTFTVTTRDPTFFRLYGELTGSEPGRGGIQTMKDSSWLLTTALFHQPKFIEQPPDVMAWWGFALYPNKTGDHVMKPMVECSGSEILEETLRHLGFKEQAQTIVAASRCIPCLLPHAGSVWLVRRSGDRPKVVPDGSTNFGFLGQFSELPKETVITMEYSIRSAREAVATLRKTATSPPPVYQGQYDPRALYEALKVLA